MAQSAPATATYISFTGILDRMSEGLTRGLTFLVENNPRYRQISAINELSDAGAALHDLLLRRSLGPFG